jgi:hypothetical protein
MTPFTLTPDLLAAIAGVVLSLAFSYIPGLNVKFAALNDTWKRLIMLFLLLVVAGVIYGLGCADIIQPGLTCDKAGLTQLVWMFVLAAMANQTTFKLTPQTKAVKAAKS